MVLSQKFPNQGRETRIRRESEYGVAGSGDFVRLNGLSFVFSPSVTTNPVRVPGMMVQAGVTVDDLFSEGNVNGFVDFNVLPFPVSGRFGKPTTTSLGGGAYQHDWLWNGRRPIRPVSFEAYSGFSVMADHAMGWIFNSLGLDGGRPDGFTVSGAGFAKTPQSGQVMGGVTLARQTITITGTPTGGDFPLTFDGETADEIPYNATATQVRDALLALDAFRAGDLTIAGGPLPGTPITVDFGGRLYAGEDVPVMTTNSTSLTGGTSPTVAVAETTPGADEVVDIAQVLAGATKGDVWVNDAWPDLGTSQLIDCLGMSLDIGPGQARVTPINSSFSSDDVIDVGEQDSTVELLLATNAVQAAEVERLIAGERAFVRQRWLGPEISGGNHHSLRIDSCLTYATLGESTATQEVDTRPLTGALTYDPVSKNCIAIRIVNELASLTPSL